MQRSVAFHERNAMGVRTLGQEEEGQLEVPMLQAHGKRLLLAALETLGRGWGRQREGPGEQHPLAKVSRAHLRGGGPILPFFFFLIYLFYFWLHWVFIAVRGLLTAVASLVAEHRF